MKTRDFLNTLAGKIGKTNDNALKDFILADNHIDLPDDICNAIVNELMSLEGAKNNSKVKAHYVVQALNGVDSELALAISDLGLDSELFTEDKDTYSKVRNCMFLAWYQFFIWNDFPVNIPIICVIMFYINFQLPV